MVPTEIRSEHVMNAAPRAFDSRPRWTVILPVGGTAERAKHEEPQETACENAERVRLARQFGMQIDTSYVSDRLIRQ
jgi:hypothetical protein